MDRIDIAAELSKIRSRGADVSSTTLLKTDTLRIVLMALRGGAKLHEHHADGRLSVQVLEGEVDFTAENTPCRLHSGMIVSLEARVPHQVAACSDAVLLLTIAWPYAENPADQAEAAKHRGMGYAEPK